MVKTYGSVDLEIILGRRGLRTVKINFKDKLCKRMNASHNALLMAHESLRDRTSMENVKSRVMESLFSPILPHTGASQKGSIELGLEDVKEPRN
jgi:hypothetical protein